mgnify:CR=1 FL=1
MISYVRRHYNSRRNRQFKCITLEARSHKLGPPVLARTNTWTGFISEGVVWRRVAARFSALEKAS